MARKTNTEGKRKKKTAAKTTQSQYQKQIININPSNVKRIRTPGAYSGSPNRPYAVNVSVLSPPTIQTPINSYDVYSLTNRQQALENAYKGFLQQKNEADAAQQTFNNINTQGSQTSSQGSQGIQSSSDSYAPMNTSSSFDTPPTPPPSMSYMDLSEPSESSRKKSYSFPGSVPPPGSPHSDISYSVPPPGSPVSAGTCLNCRRYGPTYPNNSAPGSSIHRRVFGARNYVPVAAGTALESVASNHPSGAGPSRFHPYRSTMDYRGSRIS